MPLIRKDTVMERNAHHQELQQSFIFQSSPDWDLTSHAAACSPTSAIYSRSYSEAKSCPYLATQGKKEPQSYRILSFTMYIHLLLQANHRSISTKIKRTKNVHTRVYISQIKHASSHQAINHPLEKWKKWFRLTHLYTSLGSRQYKQHQPLFRPLEIET